MYSFTFNSVDLADYDLVVVSSRTQLLRQLIGYMQVKNRAYGSIANKEPRHIRLDIVVTGTDYDDLTSNLDNIKRVCATEAAHSLILDAVEDRYYNAQLITFDGGLSAHFTFVGSLEFICVDPMGYDNDEVDEDYAINSDPKDVDEITEGTGLISPVFTLTSGENLGASTIKLKNVSTDEELTWVGTMGDAEALVIDTASWVVTLEGSASMSGVTGKFPHLYPNQTNVIRVTGFGSLGALNITYRNRFL